MATLAALRRRRLLAEQSGARALEAIDRRPVDQHPRIPDGERRAGIGERDAAPDFDLVAHRPVVRPDLTLECDLTTPERSTGPETSAPGAEEAEQLPHRVHTEAARLHRVAREVAREEPVVDVDVALRDDPAARAVPPDLDDAVDHEQRGKRQTGREAGRRIVDQPTVREGEQLRRAKVRPPLE